MSGKDEIIEFLRQLPEAATLEEISEELSIFAALRRGERAGDGGQVTSQEAVRQQIRGWTDRPLRQQVEAAERANQLSPSARQKRDEMLKRTHGALSEEDGEAFEQALNDSRRVSQPPPPTAPPTSPA